MRPEITPEMVEIARLVNADRARRRVSSSWAVDPGSVPYQARWSRQVYVRIWRSDKVRARQWLVAEFGAPRARELLLAWSARDPS